MVWMKWLELFVTTLWSISTTSRVFLAVLGLVWARVGDASDLPGTGRVMFWVALAVAISPGAGALFGAVA